MENEKNLPKALKSDESEKVSGGGCFTYHTVIVHGRKSGNPNDNEEAWNVYEILGWDGDPLEKPHVDELPYGIPQLRGSFSTKEEAVKASKCDNPKIREVSYPLENITRFGAFGIGIL